ncbi:hypothetical protein JAAARDRAFT_336759 [Jaapia argillacea MUCL 33604]|uniref:Uncharacterized protein n=1 Tax=Jaapia argillacea MUCL 33604 TaxID=933084 RepID=A0A067PW17_9AGAM|nr:hypothetical protein JAAARDRAFT_336759 [Jaapia argillacea MUCL 33604]
MPATLFASMQCSSEVASSPVSEMLVVPESGGTWAPSRLEFTRQHVSEVVFFALFRLSTSGRDDPPTSLLATDLVLIHDVLYSICYPEFGSPGLQSTFPR